MLNARSGVSKHGKASGAKNSTDVDEMWAIIDKLKRENEYLRLDRGGWVTVRGNLASLNASVGKRRRR